MFRMSLFSNFFILFCILEYVCCRVHSVLPLNIPVSVIGSKYPCSSMLCRQVPGDGSCLFHSVQAQLNFLAGNIDEKNVESNRFEVLFSKRLREYAVNTLSTKNSSLYIASDYPTISTEDLVSLAAAELSVTVDEYCNLMLQNDAWGGGPEIIALCNKFNIPIHVYELHSRKKGVFSKEFVISRCAKFGKCETDSKYDGQVDPTVINILNCDGRFPNIVPGQQSETGDHFMSLLPLETPKKKYNFLSMLYCALLGGNNEESMKLLQNNNVYRKNRARNILNILRLENK